MRNLILASAALAVTAGTALAQDTVRLGTEGAYPPYNFINDSGEVDGYEIELGNMICERAGLTCEWVTNEWDSIIPNLVSSNYDVIMAGMSITPERDEVVDFTQNYIPPAASAYIALSEDAPIQEGVVAAQTATIQAGYIAEGDATLIEFATPDEAVAAVRRGEADAVFADRDFLVPIAEGSGGELMFVGEDVQLGEGIGAAFRESDNELLQTFDAEIAELKADGTLNELIAKWFGEDAPTYE